MITPETEYVNYLGFRTQCDPSMMQAIVGRIPEGYPVEVPGYEAIIVPQTTLSPFIQGIVGPDYNNNFRLIAVREALDENLQPDFSKSEHATIWKLAPDEYKKCMGEWQLIGDDLPDVMQSPACIRTLVQYHRDRRSNTRITEMWALGEVVNIRNQGETVVEDPDFLYANDYKTAQSLARRLRENLIVGQKPVTLELAQEVALLGMVEDAELALSLIPGSVWVVDGAKIMVEALKNNATFLQNQARVYQELAEKSTDQRWQEDMKAKAMDLGNQAQLLLEDAQSRENTIAGFTGRVEH